MSPKEKHIPNDAERTSVCLTASERGAIHWIREARKTRTGEERQRTTINDILVDALWYFLKEKEGRTREQVEAGLPPKPPKEKSKITPIRKSDKKH